MKPVFKEYNQGQQILLPVSIAKATQNHKVLHLLIGNNQRFLPAPLLRNEIGQPDSAGVGFLITSLCSK